MRALKPTLVSLQLMLMHPKRRFQLIVAVLVILGLFSYVLISPSNNNTSNNSQIIHKINGVKKEEFKELLAPGPSRDFPDFDYKYDQKKVLSSNSRKNKSSSSSGHNKNNNVNFILDEAVIKSTRPTPLKIHTQKARRRSNYLNGVPLSSNLDEFDVVGQIDLFKQNGILDDR